MQKNTKHKQVKKKKRQEKLRKEKAERRLVLGLISQQPTRVMGGKGAYSEVCAGYRENSHVQADCMAVALPLLTNFMYQGATSDGGIPTELRASLRRLNKAFRKKKKNGFLYTLDKGLTFTRESKSLWKSDTAYTFAGLLCRSLLSLGYDHSRYPKLWSHSLDQFSAALHDNGTLIGETLEFLGATLNVSSPRWVRYKHKKLSAEKAKSERHQHTNDNFIVDEPAIYGQDDNEALCVDMLHSFLGNSEAVPPDLQFLFDNAEASRLEVAA
jgi:hypothetical protein